MRISEVTDQAFNQPPEDTLALARVFELAMRFQGKPAMSVDEVGEAFQSFSTQLALERLVRDGDVVKTGEYTMVPGKDSAKFVMTEQGAQKVRSRQRE